MKTTSFALLMLVLIAPGLAQTPGGPLTSPAQPQAVAPSATTQPVPAASTTAVQPAAPADDSRLIVPAETTIPMMLITPINTKSAFVGESIYLESVYPVTAGNRILIPRGSSIRGAITQVVRPGRVKGRAQIGLRFDELVLPNGTTVQLRAVLSGFGSESGDRFKPNEGRIEAEGTKGRDAGTIARDGVEGGVVGTVIGAERGSIGEGAAIGGGAGALAGVITVLATRGKDVLLPHGTSLELKLTQPINFSRWEVEPRSPYDEGPSLPRREYGPRT
jgi:type IV secretion system protein VirB10